MGYNFALIKVRFMQRFALYSVRMIGKYMLNVALSLNSSFEILLSP